VELAFLLLVGVSAGTGVLLRRSVSRRVARHLLIAGVVTLLLGIVTLFGPIWGVRPFPGMVGALVSLSSLVAAGILLPFALVLAGSKR
jgi:hypothetical protein